MNFKIQLYYWNYYIHAPNWVHFLNSRADKARITGIRVACYKILDVVHQHFQTNTFKPTLRLKFLLLQHSYLQCHPFILPTSLVVFQFLKNLQYFPTSGGQIAQWYSACSRTKNSVVQASPHGILLWRWALHLHLAPASYISIIPLRPTK